MLEIHENLTFFTIKCHIVRYHLIRSYTSAFCINIKK